MSVRIPCECGGQKHPQAKRCVECYRPRWTPEQDAELREYVAAGWEYGRIARRLKRTSVACRLRASFLGLKQDVAATLENRKRGRERFRNSPQKVERRRKRMKKAFTPDERAVRAEEARQRNLSGVFSFKGRHHTPETCARISAANTGRAMPAETREKIAAARRAYWAARRDGGQSAYRATMQGDRTRLAGFNPEIEGDRRLWCTQCERQVTATEAGSCGSRFCTAKAHAA